MISMSGLLPTSASWTLNNGDYFLERSPSWPFPRWEDVTSVVKGKLMTFLDFGTVEIQTAGEKSRLSLNTFLLLEKLQKPSFIIIPRGVKPRHRACLDSTHKHPRFLVRPSENRIAQSPRNPREINRDFWVLIAEKRWTHADLTTLQNPAALRMSSCSITPSAFPLA